MTIESTETELNFATRPISRTDCVSAVVVVLVFAAIIPGFAVVLHLWPVCPIPAKELLILDLFAVANVLAWAGLWATNLIFTPDGSWRIDADGVAFTPRRGRARSIRWKEVERVQWGPGPRRRVALRKGRFTVPIVFDRVDEPARSQAIAFLETRLRSDFDLDIHPTPDRLNDVEPAWLNLTLRIARVFLVSLVVGAVFSASIWFVAIRYPKAGAWQPQCLALCWYLLFIAVMVRFALLEKRRNPTWRARLTKKPPADPWETW